MQAWKDFVEMDCPEKEFEKKKTKISFSLKRGMRNSFSTFPNKKKARADVFGSTQKKERKARSKMWFCTVFERLEMDAREIDPFSKAVTDITSVCLFWTLIWLLLDIFSNDVFQLIECIQSLFSTVYFNRMYLFFHSKLDRFHFFLRWYSILINDASQNLESDNNSEVIVRWRTVYLKIIESDMIEWVRYDRI